ncbi:uncharacterized protein [Arachis hypogaea]|uniref:uncharacterized protein n=1 Tax=Arachis hypogaea TaxID=3818 RepID=UPI003B2257B0
MEAELKHLSQMIETVAEKNRAECARAQEATNLKFKAIHQSSLTQLLFDRSRKHSISHESPLGSNSGVDNYSCPWSQPQRVSFDLPKFDGTDASSWIFSVDQYFEFFRVPPKEQIGLTAMHMTGSAIPWFQMSQRTAQFRSWTQLKRAIQLELGPSLFESPRELLFKLQQQGSVSDFYAEFVALDNRTHIEPADALRDCFISSLQANIRCEVKAQCPPSVMRAISLARLYEDKFLTSPWHTSAAHKCSNRQFMLMQVENDEVNVVVNSRDIVVSKGENLQQLDAEVIDHHLSYNAMHDTSGHSTIRIKAHIGELEIQALIDGGSSDCFIQPWIEKFLNISIEPTPGVQVVVGNFDIMQVEGRIPLLEVTLQGYKVLVPDVFVLNVAGGDLIIGTAWLKQLRAHIVDYEAAYIRFMYEGSLITLQPQVEVTHSSLPLPDDLHLELANFCTHMPGCLRNLQAYHHSTVMITECLFAKLSKCSFGTNEIDYLGHTISDSGVHMEKDKVHAIIEWPQPTNVKQLRGFLGITGYYRRFIRYYASIASPLTDLLYQDAFAWDDGATIAFNKLKAAITSKPILALPNFELPFEVETDASETGVGAVLIQEKHLIAFFSKKLSPSLQKQSSYVREFYAITEAVAKFRHYLLGKKFIIRTDQQSLKALVDQTLHTPEQKKVAPQASGLGLVLMLNGWGLLNQKLRQMHNYKNCGSNAFKTGRLIYTIRSEMQAKAETTKLAGLLQPFPIPHQVWDDICIDFITSLPTSHGYSVIMVVIDRLTEFAHFIALRRDFDSKTVSDAFIKHIVKLHGFPKSIVSDRGKVFISKFWQ